MSDILAIKEKEIELLQKECGQLRKKSQNIQDKIDNACFECPKEGDFWHEMYVPVLAVIQVHEDNSLTICENTKDVGNNKYIFDMSGVRRITREEFEKKIKWHKDEIGYKVIPERCVGIFTQWQIWIAENL